jgi:glycosyltransferase involved in cell wall biosynthesis
VTIVNRLSASRQRAHHSAGSTDRLFDVNVIIANADQLPGIAQRLGKRFNQRYTIGVWAWEVERFPPPFAASDAYVDEVWAASAFSAEAIASGLHKPVHVFPWPVSLANTPISNRDVLQLPTGFVFLYCFDYLSVYERKNPMALVRAFSLAFPRDSSGASLVIKSINGDRAQEQHRDLVRASQGRRDIKIIDRYMSHTDQRSLIAHCDGYVSLHRAEGFGLTLAEAMMCSKPVIATGYSGNLEYMNTLNSWLVPYELVAIPPGCDPYPPGALWADPSIDAAAEAMLEVFNNPAEREARAHRARASVEQFHTPEARAQLLERLLRSTAPFAHSYPERRSMRAGRRALSMTPSWTAKVNVNLLENRLRPGYVPTRARLARPYREGRSLLHRMAHR